MRVSVIALVFVLAGCAELQTRLEQVGITLSQERSGLFADKQKKQDQQNQQDNQDKLNVPLPDGPRLAGDNVVFYHQAYSAKPYRLEDLLKEGSAAGSKKDEFERKAVYRKEAPYVKARMDEAKRNPAVFVLVNTRFGDYDFDTQSFPTGFAKDGRALMGGSGYFAADLYGASFTNGERLQTLRLPEDQAQAIVAGFRGNDERRVVAVVKGKVIGAKPGSDPTSRHVQACLEHLKARNEAASINSDRLQDIGPSGLMRGCTDLEPRLVTLRVDRVMFYLPNGKLIGTISAKGR